MYKVCWPIPGGDPALLNTCFEADMLSAMDDALGDGVDVLSISIGTTGTPPKYSEDGIAIGALHAVKRNVVVVCSAGNSGPTPATASNLAPWILTVGASSVDRIFTSPVILGNGMEIQVNLLSWLSPYFSSLQFASTFNLIYVSAVEFNVSC